MKKVYKIETYHSISEAEKALNQEADNGWELEKISVDYYSARCWIWHYYSRPKEENEK